MRVLCDIFPARLRVIPSTTPIDYDTLDVNQPAEGSRLVTVVRVIVSDDTVLVGGESSDGPMLIFRERYDPATLVVDRSGLTPSRLVTESGKVLVFDKDQNCGCGSRLRSWNPYRTLSSSKDPTE